MISNGFITYLSEQLGSAVKHLTPISGGDISDAFLVETSADQYFLKANGLSFALDMFETEKRGLEAISKTKAIKTPQVYLTGSFEDMAYLLMEYKESKRGNEKEMERFGYQLAELNQSTNAQFGLDHDNYIGKLNQSNFQHRDWISFYAKERLHRQLKMALDKKLLLVSDIPSLEKIIKNLSGIMDPIQPALIHGDLWSGNYLISTTGQPYLIDPAVYYGHGEVDIAMSRLFGGFGSSFYNAFYDRSEKRPGLEERVEIYQLYYLLVHLNLFGTSYKSSVLKILKRYFG